MRYAILLGILMGCLICAMGQNPSATISGRVLDPTKAIIQKAHVDVFNLATGVKYSTSSNGEGLFSITNLPPGKYRIELSKQGFRTVIMSDVVLHVQDVIALNFNMSVGSAVESVTVTGGAPLINTETAAVGTVIDREFVENLPLNGRSFNTLMQLTPGTVATASNRASPGQFSVNGQRTNANAVAVDGVSADFGISNSAGLSQAGSLPAFNAYGGTSSLVSVDALQEFRVQTSSFAPEYGSTPGGQVSIETRSGTGSFHGGLFDYFRNDILDANDWFANNSGLPRAAERQNDFGGFLGGPIVRNRTFFFFSYEGLQLRQPKTTVIEVPSLSVRNSAIAPAQIYLNAFPVPNGPDDPLNPGAAQFTGNYSDSVALNATSIRVDDTPTDRLTLFARYNYAPSDSRNRANALSEILAQKINTHTATIGATYLVRPNISNSFRANYSLQTAGGVFTPDNFGGATPPAASSLFPAPLTFSSGSGEFAPIETSPLDFGVASNNRATQINFVDGLSVTKGAHQMKFGVDYRALYISQTGAVSDPIYLPDSLSSFAATASVTVVALSFNPAKAVLRSTSLYGQDAWKLGKRLTLTYGLRWQVNPSPEPRNGTVLASWQNVEQVQNLQLAPAGTAPWKTTYANFAPRLGVAYQPFSSNDLVVRAGWGVFYDLGTGVAASLLSSFPNDGSAVLPGQTLPLTSAAGITPLPSAAAPFSDFIITGFDPNLKLPRSMQWNVAVEKQLAGQSVSLTYVGQNGTKLLRQSAVFAPTPDFAGFFLLTHNQDSSNYQALQAQLRRPMRKGLEVLLGYTWSHSIDTSSSDSLLLNSDTVIPAGSDRGSSDFDVRHSFSGALAYDLPKTHGNPVLAAIANNWSLYGVIQARTGLPITVITREATIPGLLLGTRPDVVPGQPFWIDDPSAPGGQRLNAAAFMVPTDPRQGNLPRNAITGFGMAQFDLSVARHFKFSEQANFQVRGDIFNLFNRPNFANPSPFLFNGAFVPGNGAATQMLNQGSSSQSQGLNPLYQVGGPRSVQLSMKLLF